jgi:hypothetical protein
MMQKVNKGFKVKETLNPFKGLSDVVFFCVVFDRKLVSQTFYANEIEDELRFRNMLDFPFHCTIKYKNAIVEIEKIRQKDVIYPHACNEMGENRSFPNLHVMDGVWKIASDHCHMKMKVFLITANFYDRK